MKRVLVFLLAVCMVVGLAGCAAKEDESTTAYSLLNAYHDFPNGGIVDIEVQNLVTLDEQMQRVQYRVLGVLSGVDTSHNEYFDIADISNGKFTMHAYFEKEENIKDGEYAEVVGHFQPGYLGSGHLYGCVVIERGSAVKERIERD
jgi:hypothetical protein